MDQPLPPMHGNGPSGMGGGPPPPPGAGGDQFPPSTTSGGGDFPSMGELPPPPPTSQPSAQPPSASPDYQSNAGEPPETLYTSRTFNCRADAKMSLA